MLADIIRPRLPLDAAGRGVDRRVDRTATLQVLWEVHGSYKP